MASVPGEGSEWSPPEVFEEYRVIRALGRGAMGHVYLAHDTLLDRPVAVKFIAAAEPDADTRERFFIEARAVARLQHPNVVAVYRVGEVRGRPYLVSEYLRGESLDQVQKPLPSRRVLEIGIELARGLAAAHRRGVLHRDLKPANAMLTEDGGIKLLDFGLAKLIDAKAHSPEIAGVVEQTLAGKLPSGVVLPEATADLPAAPVLTEDMDSGETRIRASGQVPPPPLPPAHPEPSATLDLPSPDAAAASPRSVALSRLSPDRAALTEAGAVLGSPLYMAPEAWRSDPATPQTDVYSFGALLYELVSGKAPWAGLSVPQIAAYALTREVAPVSRAAPEIDPDLAAVIDRCLRREPTERWESGESLREALERLQRTTPVAHLSPTDNPYRGLMAFEAEHRSLFFGRDAEVRAILDRLRSEPWVAVAGDSGVGKSSICRAGVVPAVLDGALGPEAPRLLTMVPGRRPLASFAAVLAAAFELDESQLVESLRKDPQEVARSLRKRLSRGGLLLFVDQLEELVTIADAEEARAFTQALSPLALPASGVRLLTTARSDFLGRLAGMPGLGDGLSRALLLLKPLSVEGIREAIVAPARAAGFSFETEQMVETLIASAARADGSLPLLQFALAELWGARDQARKVIPAAALERLGGVEGALARYADSVLDGFVGTQRAAARRILLRLVTPEGTRARRSEAELLASDPEARPALEALVHGRLLIARDTEDGEGSLEVAHEALITGWGTLRQWLSANLETRAARQRMEAAAQEWARLGRSDEVLWTARQLTESSAVNAEDLGPLEREFLARSRQRLRRRRVVRVASALGVLLGVGAVIGFVQLREARALQARVDTLVNAAEEQLASAAAADRLVEQARAKAFGLFDRNEPYAAEDALTEANTLRSRRDQSFYDAEAALESARFIDPRNLEVVRRLGQLTRTRLLLAERDHDHDKVVELGDRLARFDTDGSLRQTLSKPAVLSLETTPPGVEVTIEYAAPQGDSLRFGPKEPVGITPLKDVRLRPGSAVLELSGAGLATVRYPLVLARGEALTLRPRMIAAVDVPEGFVFVPGGEYLSGTSDAEELRRYFLFAQPIRRRATGDFLISRYEVTYAEWIAFLESLPPAERARRLPSSAQSHGYMAVKLQPTSRWTLTVSLPGAQHVAKMGEPLVYEGRQRNREVDWLKMPVTGISFADAEQFARWLAATGRVPRARLCAEDEWERAARGADGRSYPCARKLRTEDANFDATYGRVATAFGLDAVGTYRGCVSPLGLYETAGNAWEFLRSASDPDEVVFRGGCFYEGDASSHLANRNVGDRQLRELRIGLRLCADPPP